MTIIINIKERRIHLLGVYYIYFTHNFYHSINYLAEQNQLYLNNNLFRNSLKHETMIKNETPNCTDNQLTINLPNKRRAN